MSAQTEDDELALFAHQAEQEYRERNACEKCGEPAVCMWDERLFCKSCYDYSTVWEPREDFSDDDSPAPEEEEEINDE